MYNIGKTGLKREDKGSNDSKRKSKKGQSQASNEAGLDIAEKSAKAE